MRAALLVFALSLSTPAHASAKSDLTSGIVALNAEDYDRAVASLQAAVGGGLSEKDVPKARYYLGRALLQQYIQAGAAGRPEVLVQAAEALVQAREADSKGRWTSQIEAEVSLLKAPLEIAALTLLGARQPGEAQPFAEAVVALYPDSHTGHDLIGQVYDQLGRRADARAAFGRVLDLAEQSPPSPPDLLAAYAAYRAAVYERYESEDLTAALALLDRGEALLAQEWSRIAQPSPSQRQQHAAAAADLDNFRLDILLNSPERLQQALAAFEAALQAEPDSYIKAVAYAQLLEKVDEDKAIRAYEHAIEVDDGQPVAYFNLGALYVNRSVALNLEANELADFAQADAVAKKAQAELLRAKPHLERALALQPDNLEAVLALLTIAIQEEDMDAYERLKAERDRLRGRQP